VAGRTVVTIGRDTVSGKVEKDPIVLPDLLRHGLKQPAYIAALGIE